MVFSGDHYWPDGSNKLFVSLTVCEKFICDAVNVVNAKAFHSVHCNQSSIWLQMFAALKDSTTDCSRLLAIISDLITEIKEKWNTVPLLQPNLLHTFADFLCLHSISSPSVYIFLTQNSCIIFCQKITDYCISIRTQKTVHFYQRNRQ